MRPRLAIMRHSAPDDRGAVALALESDCGGVEATVNPADIHASVLGASLLGPLSGHDLPVRYHFPLGGPDLADADATSARARVDSLISTVEAMARVGGDYLTVHAALPSDSYGTQRFAETQARLTEVAAAGRDHGVTVALENLRWGATSELGAFLQLVEAADCAVTIDVGHAVSSDAAARDTSAAIFIAACSPRVRSAHVYDRETDRHHAPVDLSRIGSALDALCDAGCGWWTIELIDSAEVRHTRGLLSDYLAKRFPLAPCCPS